jgi:phosphatidylglycerophosphate synthase
MLLMVALMTDVLDGYLARKWKVTNETGYILDSLGDRAIHLALILVFLVRYDFHPLFAWLIVFRDIALFAQRVLSKEWLRQSVKNQWVSRLHGIILRIWLGLFLVRDGFRVFAGSDVLNTFTFAVAEITLLCTGIAISYYGLVLSFSWLIEYDHKTLS